MKTAAGARIRDPRQVVGPLRLKPSGTTASRLKSPVVRLDEVPESRCLERHSDRLLP